MSAVNKSDRAEVGPNSREYPLHAMLKMVTIRSTGLRYGTVGLSLGDQIQAEIERALSHGEHVSKVLVDLSPREESRPEDEFNM